MTDDLTARKSTKGLRPRELSVNGVPFTWWSVGEQPAVVTVRMPMFGSLTGSTDGDPAQCAAALARKLLAQHEEGEDAVPPRRPAGPPGVPALEKPGWFEPDDVDFTRTVF